MHGGQWISALLAPQPPNGTTKPPTGITKSPAGSKWILDRQRYVNFINCVINRQSFHRKRSSLNTLTCWESM